MSSPAPATAQLRIRLEASQRIAGIGDWESDLEHVHLHCSDQVYEILGVPSGSPTTVAQTFAARIHPDDLERVRLSRSLLSSKRRRIAFTHRIVRPDGDIRHVQQRCELVLDDEAHPTRIIGTVQDVSEHHAGEAALRSSEERFKLVAKTIGDVLWDWDLRTDEVWRSDGFENTFGLAASDVNEVQATWERLIHPEDRDRIAESLQAAARGTAQTWTGEYRVLRRDGTYAQVEDQAQIVRDREGHAMRMVGGVRDLTEQKNFEARLLRSQRLESIGVLAGGIAHDLNNVLAPILMSIDILKLNASLSDHDAHILEIIQTSARRGADLVKQVLTFSRGADLEHTEVSIRRLFLELENIVRETFPSNIEIEFTSETELWAIYGDASQLHQVLLNLAVNARDAMPQGGTLTFGARNVSVGAGFPGLEADTTPGPFIELTVADTGTGMTEEVRAKMFEAFFTTKPQGKGTGLGLASVHAIVKSYDGFMNITTAVGEGTTFKVYLPVEAAEHQASRPPMRIDNQRGEGETVLLIDDERSIRDIAKQTLEGFGYKVIVAGDGIEGIALYMRHAQDIRVVIADMMMPNCDGVSTTKALLGINPAVRIILASGMQIEPDAIAGVSGILGKPYSAQTMLSMIRDVLDQP